MTKKDKLSFSKNLQYANGYRELGMFSYALKEIEALDPIQSQSQPVLQMKLAIFIDANRWNKALVIARKLHAIAPDQAENHVNLAFVMRRAQSMETARSILIDAARKFPDEAIIPYNLACYACQNEEIDDAKSYLERAFSLDEKYLEIAIKDEDLEQLQAWVVARKED